MKFIPQYPKKSGIHMFFVLLFMFPALLTISGCGGSSGGGGDSPHYLLSRNKVETVSPWFVDATYHVADINNVPVANIQTAQTVALQDGTAINPGSSDLAVYTRQNIPPDGSYKLRIVMLFDNSPSQSAYLTAEIKAATAFVQNMNKDGLGQQEVAIVAYGEDGEPYVATKTDGGESVFMTDASALKQTIESIKIVEANTATDLYNAMLLCLSLWTEDASTDADPDFVEGFLIALTDGNDTSGLHNINEVIATRDKANILSDRNKQIIAIAVGSNAADDALTNLCNAPNFDKNGYYQLEDPVIQGTTNKVQDTMLAVGDRIVQYMNSFYWMEYRTDLTSNDTGSHTLTVKIDKNANTGSDSYISGPLTTTSLFYGQPGIYIKSADMTVGDMALPTVYLTQGLSDVTQELTAMAYKGTENPCFTWTSNNPTVVSISADPCSATATLTIKPLNSATGQTDASITVIDTANNMTQTFTIHIQIIEKAEGYTLTPYNVESHAPWFVDAMLQVNDKTSGNYLSGIGRDDFLCKEDNTTISNDNQEIGVWKHDTLPPPHTYTLKTVLLLDNSSSDADYVANLKKAAKTFVDAAFPAIADADAIKDSAGKIQQEIAVLAFDIHGDGYQVCGFSSSDNKQTLKDAIDKIAPSAWSTTSFYDAIIDGLDMWNDDYSINDDSKLTQGVIIVLTDGYDTQLAYRFEQMLQARDYQGDNPKHVMVVGVGDDLQSIVNMDELKRLVWWGIPIPESEPIPDDVVPAGLFSVASPGAETMVGNTSMTMLEKAMVEVQQQLISFTDGFYWMEYRSDIAKDDQSHSLEIALKSNTNTADDAKILSSFTTSEFFTPKKNQIYINSSAHYPQGEVLEGAVDGLGGFAPSTQPPQPGSFSNYFIRYDVNGNLNQKILWFDGWGILRFPTSYPLRAATFDADYVPSQYNWIPAADDNPDLNLAMQYKPQNSTQATLNITTPDLSADGTVFWSRDITVTVTDDNNMGSSLPFTVKMKNLELPTPPIVFYPFDTDASDASGHGFTGKVSKAVLVANHSDLLASYSYSFDGNAYIASRLALGPGLTYGALTKMTVGAWVKTTCSDDGLRRIVDFDSSQYWALTMKNGYVYFYVAGAPLGKPSYIRSFNQYNNGEWHFICITFDNDDTKMQKIYVDGVLDVEAPTFNPAGIGTAVRYGYIGSESNSTDFDGAAHSAYAYFIGQIDDVMIFNSVLTQEQIKVIAQY